MSAGWMCMRMVGSWIGPSTSILTGECVRKGASWSTTHARTLETMQGETKWHLFCSQRCLGGDRCTKTQQG
eukprot:9105543-Alexandrium_andersonii.AAC.1